MISDGSYLEGLSQDGVERLELLATVVKAGYGESYHVFESFEGIVLSKQNIKVKGE